MHTTIDVARARAETPGCKNVLHFNNAGASLMPREVLEAQISHLQLEAEIGGYEAFQREFDRLEHFYAATARLLNCDPDEIAFIENATRAWDMAFYSLRFGPGDRILTAANEYASNYIGFLQVKQRTGASVEVVPSDEHGQISLPALRGMIDERVKLIALTHVPTNGGLVQPAAAVGAIAREAGILYLLDACQSIGQIPLNIKEIGCDILSATGRKFLRGPRATGLLYMKRELAERIEPILLDMHAATWVQPDLYEIQHGAKRFENWEQNFAGKLGLSAAIETAMHWGIENIRDRVGPLADFLRQSLAEIPGIKIRDLGVERCGTVTFTAENHNPADIKTALAGKRINVSISKPEGTLLDMRARGISSMVRASVHYFNTEDEVSRFCAELRQIL